MPQAQYLGLTIPDPDLKWNEATGDWDYGAIDWDEFKKVVAGNGPCNRERLEARRKAHDEGAWVREAAHAYAEKRTQATAQAAASLQGSVRMAPRTIPLWEVFIRPRNGLAHKHVGSLHAADATMALKAARDVYTRRGEGLSIWVVPSAAITASDPAEKGMMFEPATLEGLSPPDLLRHARRSGAYVMIGAVNMAVAYPDPRNPAGAVRAAPGR